MLWKNLKNRSYQSVIYPEGPFDLPFLAIHCAEKTIFTSFSAIHHSKTFAVAQRIGRQLNNEQVGHTLQLMNKSKQKTTISHLPIDELSPL